MTAFGLALHTAQAGGQLKNDIVQSAPSSPSAASSTSDSVFSTGDARSSQSSAPSSVKGSPLTYESSDSEVSDAISNVDSVNEQLGHDFSQTSLNGDAQRIATRPAVAIGATRHPRRTAAKAAYPTLQHESVKSVPSLVRQCDRKEQFVESLVDTATEMIEVIWPGSVSDCSLSRGGRHILDLRKFVQEVLRRSKTSHSTLQVALFYMMLLIPFVPKVDLPEVAFDPAQCKALRCGRRMFLAALILASKYLQDRNYTMSAWAKISGLKKEEICFNELAFLKVVNFDLHVPEPKYKVWTELVFKCSVDDECRMARLANEGRCEKWRAIIPHLTPDLGNVTADFQPKSTATTPSSSPVPETRWAPPPHAFSAEMSDVALPPPQFLEPKVTTSADRIGYPSSPRLSKLPTPCLPPINYDRSPAVSRGQLGSNMAKCPAMGLAMKAAQNLRPCGPGPRLLGKLCSRRSGLSQCSSSASESDFFEGEGSTTPSARESYLRASHTASLGVESDKDAARAAQSLLTLKNLNSPAAYPTPESMRSLSNGSSFDEDVRTPRIEDPANRPLAKPALKRARPVSKTESDLIAPAFGSIIMRSPESIAVDNELAFLPAGMIKHQGGALVDYAAGVDDLVRSRSARGRSASGSRDGARKKPRSSLATCLRA